MDPSAIQATARCEPASFPAIVPAHHNPIASNAMARWTAAAGPTEPCGDANLMLVMKPPEATAINPASAATNMTGRLFNFIVQTTSKLSRFLE
jgi:hypothetical protein